MQLKALLLDLDGTLIDTAPDMVGALNSVLTNHGQPNPSYTEASKLVSNGARGLLEFGFGKKLDDAVAQPLIDEFLAEYSSRLARESAPYDGIQDCLALCAESKIPWGVVTNKPLQLSRQLLLDLGLLEDCRILLGGDSLPVKKPHPAPLLHCCMTLSLAASECLYVGDHERDIAAGKAAGMDTAAAVWGYLQEHDQPDEWGADFLLNSPHGLLKLLQERLS